MNIELTEDPRGQLWVWEHPEPNIHYCMGIDSALGVRGGDYSVIKVIRSDNLDEVCMWKGYIDPRELGRKTCWVGWYYNTAFAVPESNKDGQSVVWEMKMLNYPSIYRTTTYDKLMGQGSISNTLGFQTNMKTRPWLWNHARLTVNQSWGRISSKSQIQEMKQIRFDEKGQPFHPRNGHDDETIAWALALVGRDQAFQRGELKPAPVEPKTLEDRHWAQFDEEAAVEE